MIESDYTAHWWNDEIFTLQDSTRDSDIEYKIQQCEVEIVLSSDTDLETLTFDLQFGMRFYADNDALEFISTDEPEFDWYRSDMEFSDELKEEPVYEESQRTEPTKFAAIIDTADIFATKIDAYEAAVAEAAAAEAEAAEAEAAESDDTSDEAEVVESDDESDEAEASSSMVITKRGKQESEETTYTASQSFVNGFTTYE